MRQNQQKNEEYLQRRYENREFLNEYNLIRDEQYEREDPSLSVQAYINNSPIRQRLRKWNTILMREELQWMLSSSIQI